MTAVDGPGSGPPRKRELASVFVGKGAEEPGGTNPFGEPTVRVRPKFMVAMTVAAVALWMAFNTTAQVLVAEQAQTITPDHKEATLGLVLTIGAIISIFSNPLAGALSDRTTARLGRRRPWALVGGFGGGASLLALATATGVDAVAGETAGVVSLVVGWSLCQLTLNALLAAQSAIIPDQVPVDQRGVISALLGLTIPVGTVAGIALATQVGGGVVGGYVLLALVIAAASVVLVVAVADPPIPRESVPPFSWKSFLAGFWISPRRHPDFGWAWLTRFLVILGYSMGTGYLLYFLRDEVGYERMFPGEDAKDGVLLLTALSAGALLITVIPGGIISDRIGRRKVFVIGSTVVVAAGLLLLAVLPTWPAAIAAALILGAGFGVYLAVDVAMITQVLPAAVDRAKDLGVINIANAGPQAVAPAAASALITLAGGYTAMFAVAAAFTLLGAVLVQPIRSVR